MPLTQTQPALLCFSHLSWNSVPERARQLLSRAARTSRVFFIEKPVNIDAAAPRLDLAIQANGITVVTPVAGAKRDTSEALDALIERYAGGQRSVWHLAPTAGSFNAHLEADLILYDDPEDERPRAKKRARNPIPGRAPSFASQYRQGPAG